MRNWISPTRTQFSMQWTNPGQSIAVVSRTSPVVCHVTRPKGAQSGIGPRSQRKFFPCGINIDHLLSIDPHRDPFVSLTSLMYHTPVSNFLSVLVSFSEASMSSIEETPMSPRPSLQAPASRIHPSHAPETSPRRRNPSRPPASPQAPFQTEPPASFPSSAPLSAPPPNPFLAPRPALPLRPAHPFPVTFIQSKAPLIPSHTVAAKPRTRTSSSTPYASSGKTICFCLQI